MTDPDQANREAHVAGADDPGVEATFRWVMSEAARVRQMELARLSTGRAGEGAAKEDLSKRSHPAPPGAPPRPAAPQEEREPGSAESREGASRGAAVRSGARWPGSRPSLPDARPAPALEPRRLMAARMLLSGRRITDVATALGIDRHTLLRWRRDPAFDGEVRRMAMEMPMPMPEVSPPEGER